MNQEKSEYSVNFKGRNEVFDYLKEKRIYFSVENTERIDKRLQFMIRDLGLESYSDFLELIKRDSTIFDTLLNWLERGKIYNTEKKSFLPLITKKKNYNRRIISQTRKTDSKESFKTLKSILPSYPLQFPDPQDIENLPKLYNYLASQNLNHKAYKEKYFLRRVWSRMMRTNATSYADYLQVLKRKPAEINALLDTLSINVTRFFRDIDLFTKLDQEILPSICSNTPNNIRIWSAGCAIGAEAYSIAIILSKINRNNLDNIKIYASDICQDFLNQARKAIYSKDLLNELSQSQINTYFRQVDKNTFQLRSKIRDSVTFKQHDLRTPSPFNDLDLILCRNVLIYFSQEESETLFNRFYNSLKQDGYLVLGKCELVPNSVRRLFTKVDAKTRIYRRAKLEG